MARALSLAVLAAALAAAPVLAEGDPPAAEKVVLPEAGFDEAADPAADLAAAKAAAQAAGKRILVKVGGNWCVWCRMMRKFFMDEAEVEQALAERFVLLRVNVSKAVKNEAFLAGFPEVPGYPHLFVLDAEGTLLHSQDTGALEAGRGYDKAKFLAFLDAWGPGTADG